MIVGHWKEGAVHLWDCAEQGHLLEHGSYDCIACGEPCQLTFADVVDSEPIEGDPEFTAWLKAGRPRIDPDPDTDATTPVST